MRAAAARVRVRVATPRAGFRVRLVLPRPLRAAVAGTADTVLAAPAAALRPGLPLQCLLRTPALPPPPLLLLALMHRPLTLTLRPMHTPIAQLRCARCWLGLWLRSLIHSRNACVAPLMVLQRTLAAAAVLGMWQ